MTFEEMRSEYDTYNAFYNWVTVNMAKRAGYIPEKFFEFFADTCECGSENIITATLTREMCCDPNCRIKAGYRLSKLLSNFAVKGVGPKTCSTVYNEIRHKNQYLVEHGEKPLLQTNSYIEILTVPWDEYPMSCRSAAGANFFTACYKARCTEITFPELIGKLGLTNLGSNTVNLFKGISSFDELRTEILKYGNVNNFCINRGSYSQMIAFNVANSLEDIFVASVVFTKVRMMGLREIEICMTGRIVLNGSSMTKAEFVTKCNNLCRDANGVQIYEVKNTAAVKSVPFVVYSAASNSAKYRQGAARGTVRDEFGEHKVLATADEFYSILKGRMEEWNSTLVKHGKEQESILQAVESF